MGEIADMMLNGTLCMQCGEYTGEDYPTLCPSCAKEQNQNKKLKPEKPKLQMEICPECHKKLKPHGLANHIATAHNTNNS